MPQVATLARRADLRLSPQQLRAVECTKRETWSINCAKTGRPGGMRHSVAGVRRHQKPPIADAIEECP